MRRATLGRAAGRAMGSTNTDMPSSLSQNVDAVIEERGGIDPARTLRTRGLSDSSIRSTFLQHGEAPPAAKTPKSPDAASKGKVLSALSQTVLGTRSAASGAASQTDATSPSSSASAKELPHSRTASPRFAELMPGISSWAATSRTLDAPDPDAYVGSFISNAPLRPLDG